MKAHEHLTSEQLNSYAADLLEESVRRRVGRHLLQCAPCRERLPQPSIEQLRTAIFVEDDASEAAAIQTGDASKFLSVFAFSPSWLTISAAVMIVFGATIIVWLSVFGSVIGNTESAQTFELNETDAVSAVNANGKMTQTPFNASSEGQLSSSEGVHSNAAVGKRGPAASSNNQLRQTRQVQTQSRFSSKIKGEKPNREKLNIALTRGNDIKPCASKQLIETQIKESKEKIVLKWTKIPNVAKYHLYVSDDDEVLIDEYETERETSYVLKKTLDPQKTYNWKLIITLADGNTVAGAARKFTIKDFQQEREKFEKKNAVRCVAGN